MSLNKRIEMNSSCKIRCGSMALVVKLANRLMRKATKSEEIRK
jgi:hypothetical protein